MLTRKHPRRGAVAGYSLFPIPYSLLFRVRPRRGAVAGDSLFPILYSLLLIFAIAACGDEDRTYTEFTSSSDKASTSADDSAAAVARAVPLPDTLPIKPPPQDTFPISLAPLGAQSTRGTGQVAAVGKSTAISVTLSQATRGATYEGAVRQGVCTSMGASIAPLFPVSADSMGHGQAASDVPVPIDSLTKKPHVVVYGPGGRPEVCAPVRPGGTGPRPPTGTAPVPHEPAVTPDSMGRDG